MSNMSYCRFHNTELDLIDCNDALEEMADNFHGRVRIRDLNLRLEGLKNIDPINDAHVEQIQEDIDAVETQIDDWKDQCRMLSDEEYDAAKRLLLLCATIAETFSEDDLAKESDYE